MSRTPANARRRLLAVRARAIARQSRLRAARAKLDSRLATVAAEIAEWDLDIASLGWLDELRRLSLEHPRCQALASPDPAEAIARADALRQAFGKLPMEEQDALWFFYGLWDGRPHSVKECAAAFRYSASHVRALITSGRRRLGKLLAADFA